MDWSQRKGSGSYNTSQALKDFIKSWAVLWQLPWGIWVLDVHLAVEKDMPWMQSPCQVWIRSTFATTAAEAPWS